MKEAIRKADALVEALPYIQAFQGKCFVIKFGGAAMEEPGALDCVLDDVVFLQAVGIRPVVIHGGGPEISREMKARNIQPAFVHGRRVTDEATLAIVREVLGNINADLCHRLAKMGGKPISFANPDIGALRAERRRAKIKDDKGKMEEVDLGFVGDVIGIDKDLFTNAMMSGKAPVVASLGRMADGHALNINADSAAGFIAAELRAEKAVFLTDTHGIMTDTSDKNSFAETLTRTQIDELIARKVIDGGMLPKVDACLRALEGGVRKAHIIDGRLEHSLLLEIFTDKGVGTQILQ